MTGKKWLKTWLVSTMSIIISLCILVYEVDPFFVYHSPKTDKYYYEISNERSQNVGIMKYFNYNAIITGTSMTENFKTSELDKLFNVKSIKVSYSGGTFKEINDNLKYAFESDNTIKLVIRSLDTYMITYDKGQVNALSSEIPDYLYDDSLLNDIKYVLNKDVLYRVNTMILNREHKGYTDFDDYSNWNDGYEFGRNAILNVELTNAYPEQYAGLSCEEKETIKENIEQNIITLANENKSTDFYIFIPPYSVVWWNGLIQNGEFEKQIEIEKYACSLLLGYENIKLFSFSNCIDITSNLNNYKDKIHYGEWINSYILKCMKNNEFLITNDNIGSYFDEQFEIYRYFDYKSVNSQEDLNDADYSFLSDTNCKNIELYYSLICYGDVK